MSGHRPFNELRSGLPAEGQQRIDAKVDALREDMTLQELRQARQLTQENLSNVLNVGQAAIAKMEKRTDMYVSSLRSYIEAMGGQLEVVARFPDGNVTINNFAAIGNPGTGV